MSGDGDKNTGGRNGDGGASLVEDLLLPLVVYPETNKLLVKPCACEEDGSWNLDLR